jgi:CBS-domain-containing membrane protein
MEAESWDEVEAESSNATTVYERSETTSTEMIVQGNNNTSGSEMTSDSETEIVFTQESNSEESEEIDIDIDNVNQLIQRFESYYLMRRRTNLTHGMRNR